LSEEHFQFFLYQILRGLKYVHAAGIIHRDIRPRTLLVNANCDLKLCDFGNAHIKFEDGVADVVPTTPYVCTRWYRAPEVLCSWQDYDASIDVWSTGCVFAEMLMGAPLFPGMSTQHQLQLFTQILGTNKEACEKLANDKCKEFLLSLPQCPGRDFKEMFINASGEAIKMVKMLVVFDAAKRSNVEAALSAPFLEELANEEDEPKGDRLNSKLFPFEYVEAEKLAQSLRDEISIEVSHYRPTFFKDDIGEDKT